MAMRTFRLSLALLLFIAIPRAYAVTTIADVLTNGQDGQTVTVQGTITAVQDDGEELILADGTGQIVIDLTDSQRQLGFTVGQRITVIGEVKRGLNRPVSIEAITIVGLGANQVQISGRVLFNGQAVCALVLANGQFMFSCDGLGSYSLLVPLDGNGQVTLFAFADGLQPFRTVLGSGDAVFDIQMTACR